ncbi:hypothetical protein WNY51_04270 [Pseudocolwellia sp. AS88]|uniref:hypothetical protein n=1 Tax=Pseudocolwellia sp. AS88 TaxID=3063958 RepID=UPI0026EEB116|nr:hypothetical protein [Pseudocolwellia sp. AS88]MDO7086265.1 hypothetical protein [Pseudocolwellia sp. AS88]
MAIWQFSIVFIPAQWAEDNKFKTDSLYGEDGFETSHVWSRNAGKKDFETSFNSILPKAESWSDEIDIWGNAKTNDLTIFREGNKIQCIQFRLDLRDKVLGLTKSIINSAISLNCVLFIPSKKVIIKPNIFELKKYITQSSAAKYIENPEAFLRGLAFE